MLQPRRGNLRSQKTECDLGGPIERAISAVRERLSAIPLGSCWTTRDHGLSRHPAHLWEVRDGIRSRDHLDAADSKLLGYSDLRGGPERRSCVLQRTG